MCREKIVQNGCSGNCCDKFTFPYSISDLDKMIAANEKGEKTFVDDKGLSLRVNTDVEQLKKIREMLIPLGETDICPQLQKTFLQIHLDLGWQPSSIIQDNLSKHIVRDGKVYALIFTCKHFDTVNRICSNYENRPNMCKTFPNNGEPCRYQGCKYGANDIFKQAEEAVETLKHNE